ncbi:fimbrillin family protein [Bacteroides fragilis]|nr:fimbrillin family protein [Bacteroides fragilis]MCS2359404.1 fimbrillin family protein [Bacteroides fragilis]PJY65810.1 fimbrillin-like protein [Bacteroides fragilis]
MKRIRNYSLLVSAMLTFAFTSCNNNEIETIPYEGPVPVQVTAGIDGAMTRASETSWEHGDAIGISCSGTNTNYTNMKYVTAIGNGTFTHYNGNDQEDFTTGIFFQGTDQVTFSAYYPFTGTEGSKPGTEGKISGSTSARGGQIDYLYAGGLTATYARPNISFSTTETKFKHKMTRLKLVLETSADAGFSVNDVTTGTYVLGGLKHEGTFNVITGIAAATESADPVANFHLDNFPSVDANNQRTYTLILYPQTVSGALPFTATISSQNYKNTADITFTDNKLLPGTSYTFTITIKKTGLTVNSCTIDGWGTGAIGSGTAEM